MRFKPETGKFRTETGLSRLFTQGAATWTENDGFLWRLMRQTAEEFAEAAERFLIQATENASAPTEKERKFAPAAALRSLRSRLFRAHRESGAYKRIVMVKFKDDASAADIDSFQQALNRLAALSEGLLSMDCGPIHRLQGEESLSAVSPDVSYGDFISIWTFKSEHYLQRFIDNPEHKKIAARYFKPVVSNRYVINHLSRPHDA
ncbi:Dabb family protein [Hahella sp. HN01]|uniref:Dabb family protein n=1 Tax=Hahella sp. HN01 TaxID=2847262 RepID=UPI001C1E91A9|nr:Dabb family protein [Hahella sp. HN01]MBU6950859.1 Dabb family protein [Hahella sp. HN01]